MIEKSSEKRKFKKDLKRRLIEILIFIPAGLGFAWLFYYVNLSVGLQLFLTVVCWGAVVGIVELIFWLISKKIAQKEALKPKKKDPFAD